MANKYDNFAVKIAILASAKESLSNNISDLTKKIEMLNKKQIKTEKDLKRLEKYGRRKNLEIHVFHLHKTKELTKLLKKRQMCSK